MSLFFLLFLICLREGASQLYAVGYNVNGQLGDNTTAFGRSTLVHMVPSWNHRDVVKAIAAGSYHSIALAGEAVYAVGLNTYGQLGDNTTTDRVRFVRIIPTWGHSCRVSAVASSGSHTMVLAGGHPFSVGLNANGQLGDGTTTSQQMFVRMIRSWDPGVCVTVISAGSSHSVVLAGGALFAVGGNYQGQLGDNTTTQRLIFLRIMAEWGSIQVTAVAAGSTHTLVLAGGQVFATGDNSNGQLVDGTQTSRLRYAPVLPAWGPDVNVTAFAAGTYHTVVVAGNDVFAAGSNTFGQLGLNTTASSFLSFARMVHVWDHTAEVTAVAAGFANTVVIAGGKPYAVGQNGVGQLGDGTTRDRSIPVPMITPWGRATVATAVAAGFSHFVVLAGSVTTDSSPPSPDMSPTPSPSPMEVPNPNPSPSPAGSFVISPNPDGTSPASSPAPDPDTDPSPSPTDTVVDSPDPESPIPNPSPSPSAVANSLSPATSPPTGAPSPSPSPPPPNATVNHSSPCPTPGPPAGMRWWVWLAAGLGGAAGIGGGLLTSGLLAKAAARHIATPAVPQLFSGPVVGYPVPGNLSPTAGQPLLSRHGGFPPPPPPPSGFTAMPQAPYGFFPPPVGPYGHFAPAPPLGPSPPPPAFHFPKQV